MSKVVFGEGPLSIDALYDIAVHDRECGLSGKTEFADKINAGAVFLDEILKKEHSIYGVTTGYGDSCTRGVPLSLVEKLPVHLSRYHGCGLGRIVSPEQTRATLAVRLASLCRGMSGVSMELLRALETLLKHNILPVIPEEGSVGASGDLTPLSYIVAALIGEREVRYQGRRRPTMDVFNELGLTPHTLRPKEALAVMNGTSLMTAMAALAYKRAEYLADMATRLTSMASIALKGNPDHFDAILFEVKPHPGQGEVGARIRQDLGSGSFQKQRFRLQDRYSIRCAPHVIGVLRDMFPTFRTLIETEINSANDNPIVDAENSCILNGGNFYGGHIAFVMDGMKNLVANISDLLDRQMALLVDEKFSHGLPANLSGATGEETLINHGLKALQISLSAWTAEALQNTMPASVFSRSTECHNQDKVSMGTIAARGCLRVLELSEQVVAGHLIAVSQALRIRLRDGELDREDLTPDVRGFLEALEKDIPFIADDQPLEPVLRHLVTRVGRRHWPLYE